MSVLNFIVSGWRMLNGSYEAGDKLYPPTPAEVAEDAAKQQALYAKQMASESPANLALDAAAVKAQEEPTK